MKEHPILFSTGMIRSLLSGRKTQTRRIFKDHPRLSSDSLSKVDLKTWMGDHPEYILSFCPYGKPGDLLWVRETMAFNKNSQTYWPIADGYGTNSKNWTDYEKTYQKVIPSIHVPKDASRIWLQVEDIRVERLHDITEADAIAEGIEILPSWPETPDKPVYKNYLGFAGNPAEVSDPKFSFMSLFSSINQKNAKPVGNPWVWVIEFKVLSTTGRDDIAKEILLRQDGREVKHA